MKIRWKALAINIIVPLAVGAISGLLTREGMQNFSNIIKPAITPPSYVIPIIWTVLYILMGISTYLIYASDASLLQKEEALRIYALQLGVNFLWSFIFFNMSAYLLAFVWLVLLWGLIIAMILAYYPISKCAALLQIPYLLWVTFAGYLTFMIYQLNKP